MKPIPIEAAKKIAKQYEYDQVVVIARAVDKGEHVTTYGKDKANCNVAARIGDYLKYEIMKWDRNEAERVDELTALRERIRTLEAGIEQEAATIIKLAHGIEHSASGARKAIERATLVAYALDIKQRAARLRTLLGEEER